MVDFIKKVFGKKKLAGTEIKAMDISKKARIAECVLLLAVAKSDEEFDDTERDELIRILEEDFGLSDDYREELIKISEEERKSSIDLYQFIRIINENYSEEEKLRVIENIWRLIYADGKLDKYEDYLVHRMANMLKLRHKQLIDAKLKAKKF